MNAHSICVPIKVAPGTLAVGTSDIFAFEVPSDALGGGVTLTSVKYGSDLAIASGSAPTFAIVYKNQGTVQGTIGINGAGAFTAGTPLAGTLTETFIDAGYEVYVQVRQTAANAQTPIITASINYVFGV